MSYPVWPAALPRPTRAGYGAQPADVRIPRRNDAGVPDWEPRYSRASRGVEFQLKLTRNQKAILDRFYAEDLGLGIYSFRMPDPIYHGWPLASSDGRLLRDDTGRQILISDSSVWRWGDEPPAEGPIQGVTFTMSFSLWKMPR